MEQNETLNAHLYGLLMCCRLKTDERKKWSEIKTVNENEMEERK